MKWEKINKGYKYFNSNFIIKSSKESTHIEILKYDIMLFWKPEIFVENEKIELKNTHLNNNIVHDFDICKLIIKIDEENIIQEWFEFKNNINKDIKIQYIIKNKNYDFNSEFYYIDRINKIGNIVMENKIIFLNKLFLNTLNFPINIHKKNYFPLIKNKLFNLERNN
jgi:hypothetical protein